MSLADFSLEGKVAVVVGARRGMGKAFALGFAEAGADVAVTDRVKGPRREGAGELLCYQGRHCHADPSIIPATGSGQCQGKCDRPISGQTGSTPGLCRVRICPIKTCCI